MSNRNIQHTPDTGIQPVENSPKTTEWPIRVGGCYVSRIHSEEVSFRVTAIAGNDIHFVHRHDDGHEFGPMGFRADHFRSMAHPEDQSPIPELLKALKIARCAFMGHNEDGTYRGDGISFTDDERDAINAAISNAEAH